MVLSLIGTTREQVRAIYGLTNRTDDTFDTFSDHGLIFHYDLSKDVRGITAGLMQGGVAFGGAILGIRLEDTLEKCVQLWGPPALEEERDAEWGYRKIAWKRQGYLLELEVWNSDGSDSAFGPHNSDTVKCIDVTLTWACAKCSFLNDWTTTVCKACGFRRKA